MSVFVSILFFLLFLYACGVVSLFVYAFVHGRNVRFRDKRVKTLGARILVILLLSIFWPISVKMSERR